tara:strand:+ start:882 stop:1076 length:195 start_codon:yes stop_codon:yes gene_type:complete
MEEGINILTQGQNVRVEGAEELIEDWENGKITMEELRTKILELETVYVDLTKVVEPTQFKDSEE